MALLLGGPGTAAWQWLRQASLRDRLLPKKGVSQREMPELPRLHPRPSEFCSLLAWSVFELPPGDSQLAGFLWGDLEVLKGRSRRS